MLEVLQYAFAAVLIGIVYAHILPDDPTPLSGWFKLLSAWAEEPDKWWKYPRQWLAYPMGYCPKCCAGQIALWSFLYFQGFTWVNAYPAVVCAAIAIISTPIIIKLYEWKPK